MEPSFNDESTQPNPDDSRPQLPPDSSASPDSPTAPPPSRGTSNSFLTGVKFGKENCFTLQKLRYQGGMGEIWAAWMNDPRTSRRVAVKIIRPEVLSSLSRELFEREIEMHRRVADVDGVLPLVDTGRFAVQIPGNDLGGSPRTTEIRYLATEWISNVRSLDQACRDLSWEERIKLFVRICEILDVIHKRAIVHCDLKPHNILIDERGNPYIADFGLAISKLPTDRESTGLDIGSIRGTWSYMAPEQCAKHCDPYGYKASLDVYALGVTFYECLTGSLPYPTDPGKATSRGEASRIINEQLHVSLRHKGRTLPPRIYAALTKACSSDPNKRFADAGKLGAALSTSPTEVRIKEVGYGLATLAVMFVLFWSVFYWITYTNPTYDLFRQALVKMTPVAQSLDHVVVIVTDDESDAKVDALANLNGLGTESSRAVIGVILDRLRELDASAVAIDSWFYQPGVPQANDMMLSAVNTFEGKHKGKVVIAKTQWVDDVSKSASTSEKQRSEIPTEPTSSEIQTTKEPNSSVSAPDEPDRYPISAQLDSLKNNIGAVCIHIDSKTHFVESELVFSHGNGWTEPSFTLLSVLAFLNRHNPAEYQFDWQSREPFFSVSLKHGGTQDTDAKPLTFELSSVRNGSDMNSSTNGEPQLYAIEDTVGLFNVGAVPSDRVFQYITFKADALWEKDQADKIKALNLKDRVVVIGQAPGPPPVRPISDAAAPSSNTGPASTSTPTSAPHTEKVAVVKERPMSREELKRKSDLDPNSFEAQLLDYYDSNDMHWVGDRWIPGYFIQATMIDSIINDQSPNASAVRARMTPIKLVSLDIEGWLCLLFSACMLVVSWWSCSQPSIKHRTRFLIMVALLVTGLCLLLSIALFLGMGIIFSPFNLMFAMLFSALAGSLIPWITPVPKRRNGQETATAST